MAKVLRFDRMEDYDAAKALRGVPLLEEAAIWRACCSYYLQGRQPPLFLVQACYGLSENQFRFGVPERLSTLVKRLQKEGKI